jgi:RNA polymerase sigma factor (sigma-70 family)
MTEPTSPAPLEDTPDLGHTWQPGDAQPSMTEDQRAFTRLYEAHEPAIHDFLARWSRSQEVAADLTQATFLRAWESRASIRDMAKARAWLFTIAERELRHYHRDKTPTVELEQAESVESTTPGPEDVVAHMHATELVWGAAQSLGDRQFEVLNLTVRLGLNREEVAEVMGVTPAYASVLMLRSREALATAVTTKLVASQAERCPGLARLVPGDVTDLSAQQNRSVEHHMRTCDGCKGEARRLTDPVALFAAVPLLPLSEALKQWRPQQRPVLAAQHFPRRFLSGGATRGLLIGGAVLALLGLGAVGGHTLLPRSSPPPSVAPARRHGHALPPVATVTHAVAAGAPVTAASASASASASPMSPIQTWTQVVDQIRNSTSYHVEFTNSAISPNFVTWDLHALSNGDWFGTVTNTDTGSVPATFASRGGQLFAQGGPGFVASHMFRNLTTQQAEALGSGWINLNADEPGGASFIQSAVAPVIDRAQLADALAPVGAVTEQTVTNPDGTVSIVLTDGESTLTMPSSPGGQIILTTGDSKYVIDSVNAATTVPTPTPLSTVAQLTGQA